MAKTYISGIKDKDQVQAVFLVKEKITAMAKNGKPYLTLRLMDRSGEIEGRVWDNVEPFGALFEKDDFIQVRAKASVYLGKMQLVIADLTRIPEEDVELVDFLPESDRDPEEMTAELRSVVDSLSDPHLKGLMLSFIDDPSFLPLYRSAPAAKGMHHVCLGGLLEHSLSVAKLVDTILPLYGGMNRDLLVVGALLHDCGKVREMTYCRSFDYTDEGKLIGHITIGVEMIQEKIAAMEGFPAPLAMLLKHMILSHHGQYEFGSPKRPKTLEATVLNYLDDLDSKINGIRSHFRREPENRSNWSSYHRLYDRYFYKGNGLAAVESASAEPVEVKEEQIASSSAPQPSKPEKARPEDFANNPFKKLQDANLDLF